MDVDVDRDGPWMWMEVGTDHGCSCGRDGLWMWRKVGRTMDVTGIWMDCGCGMR